MIAPLLALSLLVGSASCWEKWVLSDQFLDTVNDRASWTARRSFHQESSLKNLLSVFPERALKLPAGGRELVKNLPQEFDARAKWKKCKSLQEVYNQGNCASGWAVAVTSVYRDRLCVFNSTRSHISAHFLMSCCGNCGQGCFGGYVDRALLYLQNHGLPVEGKKGCQPYAVPPCPTRDGNIRCHKVREQTGWCYENRCSSTGKTIRSNILTKSRSSFSVYGEDEIKSEIFSNGPVLAVMTLYEDFFVYKTGVYEHKHGKKVGKQEVKILGWGVDKKSKQKYWLVVNSWGSIWGESGRMKIVRGKNECDLEENVFSLLV